jgi:hypothetical protein
MNKEELGQILEAINSASVFSTPFEKLKNWNEYKEDSTQRLKNAKEMLEKELNNS